MINNKTNKRRVDYTWPGFVDALASLLMVIIFVLLIFVLSQFFLAQKMTGQDQVLVNLKNQLVELTDILSIERQANIQLTSDLLEIENKLNFTSKRLKIADFEIEKNKMISKQNIKILSNSKLEINNLEKKLFQNKDKLLSMKLKLAEFKEISLDKANEVNIKSKYIAKKENEINKLIKATMSLKSKLSQLQSLLAAYKSKDKKEKIKTINIGKDLNSALARRVEELQKFKSEFFGRVKELIKERPEIRIVGDRFVFQSEVLFKTGATEIGSKGKIEMKRLAATLLEIEKSLPTDINWILQIEGHTDNLPVKSGQLYNDNWELSTKRSLSILRFLIREGIQPNRLSASGYGSFQPIDSNNNSKAREKNRRIEMKIIQNLKLK